MAETIEEKVKRLEEGVASYRINGAVGLYYELNRLINETIKYTRSKSISSLLSSDETSKGDKTFERTMALIKNAKEHVLDMEEIKSKLGLLGNEAKDKEKVPFIETVATKRD